MPHDLTLPFELPAGSSVLVAGCGGGFDVMCAVPVAHALACAGHRVHLGNYSVADLGSVENAEQPVPGLYRVDAASVAPSGMRSYPEGPLARWWSAHRDPAASVWCFARPGVRPMVHALTHLKERLALDAVVMVDGGVDGLFVGTEHDTGTPSMDAISIIATHCLPGVARFYAFTAFGTEGPAYRIRHADVLERVSELIREQALLGVTALLDGTPSGRAFLEALEAVHSELPPLWHSIIASSVASAMQGSFGEKRLTPRTEWAPVWVSPLTLLYWFCDLDAVARAKPFLREVIDTSTVEEVVEAIDRVRERLGAVPRRDIPV